MKPHQHFVADRTRWPVANRKIKTHQLSKTGEWFAWYEFGELGKAGTGKTEEEAIDALLEKELA